MKICEENDNFFLDSKGILREKAVYSENQEQTKNTFSFKWNQINSYSGKEWNDNYGKWLKEKYFSDNDDMINRIFSAGNILLDAGCGAAMSAIDLFGEKLKELYYVGVDISNAIEEAQVNIQEFCGRENTSEFVQCDLNHIPLSRKVDVIFSEGVLHHTDSTKEAIFNLSRLLNKNGWFLFYVYAKKAPIREFTDDYIRAYFEDKSNEETWEELKCLTKLGKILGDLNITLNIEDDVPFLGIKAGKIDLQRFVYWYLFKCFYRPEYNIEEMNHINFDWYRPKNCHRQSPEEIVCWCKEAGLKIARMNVEESGITVVAIKE